MVKGKVAYMSPEQARGKPLDPRSDLFALATVLWEMLTNKRLFLRASDFETLTAILKEEAEPPSKYRKGIDQELDDIIMTALEKDREHRQANVEVFARELNRWYYKHVTNPEAETARAFMRKIYADKIAKLPGKQAEPATVRAAPRASAPVPEPVKKGEIRRHTNRMESASESPSTLKLNDDLRREKGPGRTVEASAPEVLRAKPPRRAQKLVEPELASAPTILEDSGLSQAELMKALEDSQRKKAAGEGGAGQGKKAGGGRDEGAQSNTKLLVLLALVALGVGGVLAFVLTR
jgi:serine/threonine protein kinase